MIDALGIKDHGSVVHFHETLWRVASAATGTDMRDVMESEVFRVLNKEVNRSLPVPKIRAPRVGPSHTIVMYTASQVNAVLRVQARWKARNPRVTFLRVVQEGNTRLSASPIA